MSLLRFLCSFLSYIYQNSSLSRSRISGFRLNIWSFSLEARCTVTRITLVLSFGAAGMSHLRTSPRIFSVRRHQRQPPRVKDHVPQPRPPVPARRENDNTPAAQVSSTATAPRQHITHLAAFGREIQRTTFTRRRTTPTAPFAAPPSRV